MHRVNRLTSNFSSRDPAVADADPALLHRDADWHRAHAVDEVRVRAARRRQHLDDGMARQQFLPQDAQLQFGEAVADAAMDAEAE